MLIGYARVSTVDQTMALQQDALSQAGCERVYTDTMSGALADRPGLNSALEHARAGDTLVVWRLDRLGRSIGHLIATVAQLDAAGIGLRSVTEQLDTTTAGGRLILHIFAALAQFERDLIRERTAAGLQAARARGRLGGRRRVAGLDDPRKVRLAQTLYDSRQHTADEIARQLGVSRATLYRYIQAERQQPTAEQ